MAMSEADDAATTGALRFETRTNPAPLPDAERAEILGSPGFGQHFTDHMARVTWTEGRGWYDARVEPYGPLMLDPSAKVLHYAQEIFEGLKAFRWDDGSVWAFRPEANAARFTRSAERMALPLLPEQTFLDALSALVAADEPWVPTGGENSLYLRPFMFGSEATLGVRSSKVVDFLVIAGPAGPYFPNGVKPVSIWLSRDYTRAGRGGMGAAKTGGNYASGLQAQRQADEHGCDQVVFLDVAEERWVEELGGMNVFFVHADGTLVTPALTGTILEGVTRRSVMELAKDLGLDPVERGVDIAEWTEGVRSGEITEVFACGTAAAITPIGRLVDGETTYETPGPLTGPDSVAGRVRSALLDIQYGRVEDTRGWMHRLV